MFKRIGFALGVVALVSIAVAARALSAPQQMPRDRTVAEQRTSDSAGFERQAAALEADAANKSSDPSAQHLLAAFYFEKTRDTALTVDEKRTLVKRALAAEDRALAINPDYVEALVYKNILLRVQATLEDDSARRAELVRDADALRTRALELQRTRQAQAMPEGTVVNTNVPPPPPPPPPGGTSEPIEWVYARTTMTTPSGQTPVKTKDVKPIHAPMLIASGVEGEVRVEASIAANGKVSQVRVVKSVGMLTQAAVDAVRQWEFDPGTVPQGGAVLEVTATFTLPSR